MSDGIDLATKIAAPATDYPSAYEGAREVWARFFTDEAATESDYIHAVTTQIKLLEKFDVPLDERTDVIIAAFWAASAESILNRRDANVEDVEQMVRTALEDVWAEVDDGK